MAIKANTDCFYIDENHRVINAVTLSDESRDGYIQIKNAPEWRPHLVRAINVFLTHGAAQRAAVTRAAKRSTQPPSPQR